MIPELEIDLFTLFTSNRCFYHFINKLAIDNLIRNKNLKDDYKLISNILRTFRYILSLNRNYKKSK